MNQGLLLVAFVSAFALCQCQSSPPPSAQNCDPTSFINSMSVKEGVYPISALCAIPQSLQQYLPDDIKNFLTTQLNSKNLFHEVKNLLKNFPNGEAPLLSNLWNMIKNDAQNAYQKFKNSLPQPLQNLLSSAEQGLSNLASTAKDEAQKFYNGLSPETKNNINQEIQKLGSSN